MHEIKELTANELKVKIYQSRLEMGANAAEEVAGKIKELLLERDQVNMIFAAAPSQNEFLAALSQEQGIDWHRVNAFHMDEYISLPKNAPQSFGQFLRERIFDKVRFNEVHYLDGNADVEEECLRYTKLLLLNPPHIVCMGIGENAHIAFNDPHLADFDDPLLVKVVKLDEVSRQQQVHDGCFAHIDDVPVSAITLTIPALLQAETIYCIVPGEKKAEAVYHTLNSEVIERYPSTILRRHSNATLYLDKDSAAKL